MRLRGQALALRWTAWTAAAILAIVALRDPHDVRFWGVPVIGLLGWLGWQSAGELVVRRAFGRFAHRMEAERYGESKALLDELRELYAGNVQMQELLRCYDASVLLAEGRALDAVRMLDAVDRERLGAPRLPWLLNNLAWALAESGDGARAVLLARESLAASGDASTKVAWTREDLRGYQLGTLGAALVVAGDPEEAVAPLEQALEGGGTPAAQTARALYLGKAFHGLGRDDEAVKAWTRAAATLPSSRYARRAVEHLRARRPYRGG